MANILITSEYFGKFSGAARELLVRAGHRVIDNPWGHRLLGLKEIVSCVGEAEAIICDLEPINAEVIAHAPRLRLVCRRGVGLDSVDLAACAARGIEVRRTPGIVEQTVAELVMALILEVSRRVGEMNRHMHAGRWNKLVGHSTAGKTLGLLGFGGIASEVALRARCFGMDVAYYDVKRKETEERRLGARYLPEKQLFEQSDFLSVHVPLTSETAGLINYAALCRMKPGAVLINTARGGLVAEEDLARALSERRLGGACIDVFEREPREDSPLRGFDNVILTPHAATFTAETFTAMDVACAEHAVRFFKEEALAQC